VRVNLSLEKKFIKIIATMSVSGIKVLMVEDVNTVRTHLKEAMRAAGFEQFESASNGEEAKQKIEMDTYQLILADLIMSPTNGIELLDYIRAHPEYSKVAFVMVTADSTKENVATAVGKGVDDYLIKPLTPDAVNQRIMKALKKRKVI